LTEGVEGPHRWPIAVSHCGLGQPATRSRAWLGLEECGVAVHAGGQRVVGVVGELVDGDHVRAVGEMIRSGDAELAVVQVEQGDPAAFGGDLEPVRARVVGQHVGLGPDRAAADRLSGGEVDGEQGGVGVAGHEAQPVGWVEGQPMGVIASR